MPHLLGQPARMEELCDLGIPIIEDCAQSIGARYQGRCVGSFGDVAICSFYATQVITTGKGGMVLSDNEELPETIRDLRDYDEKNHYMVRFNYEMTDMQAALGVAQVRRLRDFIAQRRRIADFYDDVYTDLPARLPSRLARREPIFYRYLPVCFAYWIRRG